MVERKRSGKLSKDYQNVIVERSEPLELDDIGGISLIDDRSKGSEYQDQSPEQDSTHGVQESTGQDASEATPLVENSAL